MPAPASLDQAMRSLLPGCGAASGSVLATCHWVTRQACHASAQLASAQHTSAQRRLTERAQCDKEREPVVTLMTWQRLD